MDLVRAEVTAVLEPVLRGDGAPFGLYAWRSEEPAAAAARAVERAVFAEVFGNSGDLLEAEYGPYEPASVFLCVVDHARVVPAGMLRLILPSVHGQKSLHDVGAVWGADVDDLFRHHGIGAGGSMIVDVASLAVAPEYRGGGSEGLTSLALYQGLATGANAAGVGWLVAILDLVVLDLVQSLFARPFRTFEGLGPRSYLDSPSSLPVWTSMAESTARLADTAPGLHRQVVLGQGLEAAVSHPAWEDVAALFGGEVRRPDLPAARTRPAAT